MNIFKDKTMNTRTDRPSKIAKDARKWERRAGQRRQRKAAKEAAAAWYR